MTMTTTTALPTRETCTRKIQSSRIGHHIVVAAIISILPTSAGAETIAIKGGRVYVEPNKVIDRATLVIRNGVVRSVGKNVAVPSGARVIDASGKIVTAGFIESSTALGLLEVSLESSTREGSFGDSSQPIHAAYRVSDGYNATSVAIPVARAQGVTSAVAVPRGGLVSGTSGWFSLADAMTPDVTVKAPLAMYASLGEASLGSAQGSRGMAILRLRELLDDARTYSRQKPNYQRNQSRPFAAARLDLEALIPVVQGRLPLVVRAHRSSDILAALRLAGEFGLRVAIEGGTEAWMVAKELARARIGVILNPAANLPQRFERTRVRDDAAKLLAEAGVAVAISSIRGPMDVATIRQLAGIAVANGMAYEHALAAVTSVPAALFGVDRGTIGPGKAADIVIWSGDPFELSTRAEHVIIAGRVTSTRNRQTLLLERYRTLAR